MNLALVAGIMAASALAIGTLLRRIPAADRLVKAANTRAHIPTAVSMLVITAHISEITRVLEHASLLSIAGAIVLCSILAAVHVGVSE